ncbi:hypothetical protein K505DRAFT_387474 [Melanomma pulvis-pyrius CBS 109.77]|uniref:Uncharacterized protein n=1 Tax=Melanomma pulvis-pyrius CBS 109.77 TaxID=1314802 RepID=A0A6A6X7U1_9PLEO|nr:hypothetical protein K505DRAFT_387474 [Melanomma pulvis-pyrius CBS 109.77]
MSIRINATVHEARAAAGHNKEQWDRFYFITKDEAKQLSEAHTDWTRWILIPANEKDTMLGRINGRLVAEGIPAVEMIILKWRMSQLLRDIQRKYANNIECLAEGSMLQGIGGRERENTGSPTLSPSPWDVKSEPQSPPPSDQSPIETRPRYDPIRDV